MLLVGKCYLFYKFNISSTFLSSSSISNNDICVGSFITVLSTSSLFSSVFSFEINFCISNTSIYFSFEIVVPVLYLSRIGKSVFLIVSI